MAAPSEYVYTFEKIVKKEKPENNATHTSHSPLLAADPMSIWHNSGEKQRGLTIWKRAKSKKISPEYRAFLKQQEMAKKSQLNELTRMIGQMRVNSPSPSNNENNIPFGTVLASGKTSKEIKNELKKEKNRLESEVNQLTKMLETMGGSRKTLRRKVVKKRKTHRKRN
jgi:chromosome condensin MukBEF ATPase and DNA-binding subunit MukB